MIKLVDKLIEGLVKVLWISLLILGIIWALTLIWKVTHKPEKRTNNIVILEKRVNSLEDRHNILLKDLTRGGMLPVADEQ